eukprot:6200974-Pleurochrysis_carterae.AAC.4
MRGPRASNSSKQLRSASGVASRKPRMSVLKDFAFPGRRARPRSLRLRARLCQPPPLHASAL